MSAEKKRNVLDSAGQANVLPMTMARNHSGRRPATPSPIGPPQS
jgi:hypothetical protein